MSVSDAFGQDDQQIKIRKLAVLAERGIRIDQMTSGFKVVNNQGQIIKRFRDLAKAQAYIQDQGEDDRLSIRQADEVEFAVKTTAYEIALSDEADYQLAQFAFLNL